AFWLDFFNKFLERNVLICISAKGCFLDTCYNVLKSGAIGENCAEYQCVGEEANHLLDLSTVTICYRCANNNVVLPAITCEQHLKTREQHHKNCNAVFAAEIIY